METFHKWKNEVIEGFNDKNWLGVNISKVGRCSSKMYVYSRCLIRAIGILNQTFHNASKGINIMSTTMGGMGKDLQNLEKGMEYYGSGLHQVEKRVEFSNIYGLSLT